MDRHRGDRGGDGGGRYSRMPSRWSDAPPPNQNHRYPSQSRGGGGGGGGDGFPGGRHHPYRGAPHDFPSGGGGPGFRTSPDGFDQMQMPLGGPRRGGGGGGYPGSGRGDSPDNIDRSAFAKLFIGSVPRTATEEDIRPLFEDHGDVIEVALIKDKRTGQQQGCCFIKYATSEEADRAIRALHNQYTLPGGLGPIQVRYADGERERLGAVEYKLFVGSLNKQATEKEVEEIFAPYGRVEDVYIMKDDLKQSRGCGFVKFSNREMAGSAITGLNGIYVMMGCDQPLTVRFADPKRPRPGESRGGPAFGGPGFGQRSQAPLGVRPMPDLDEPMAGRTQSNKWDIVSPRSQGPTNQVPAHGFSSQFASKGGALPSSSPAPGSLGGFGVPTNGAFPGLAAMPSSTSLQSFNPSTVQFQPTGQQISPLQKPFPSPQHLPPSLQLQHHQQSSVSYSHTQALQAPMQQPGQLKFPHSGGFPSSESLSSQHLIGLGGQFPSSQALMPSTGIATLRTPLNLHLQGVSVGVNQQQLPPAIISQQLLQQPFQQSPTQVMLQQQAQTSLSSFQSSQQALQLQQLMQPSSLSQQQSSQNKQQSPWSGINPQSLTSTPSSAPIAVVPSSISTTATVNAQVADPLNCDWTEHTSPEGYKYYYNCVTKESKWEKPEELTMFEQQQKLQQSHHKLSVQQLQSQSQMQPHAQVQSAQQHPQMQQIQSQMQLRQQGQSQLLQPSLSFQSSGAINNQNIQDLSYAQLQAASSVIDPVRVQQGVQAAQEWMWKNKSAGS